MNVKLILLLAARFRAPKIFLLRYYYSNLEPCHVYITCTITTYTSPE